MLDKKFSRRSMFGAVAMAIAGSVAIARAEYDDRVPTKDKEDGGTYYRGYRMYFTGWKYSQSQDLMAAQWVAYPVHKNKDFRRDNKFPYLVAPVPGNNAAYKSGDYFDIAPRGSQKFVNWKTTPESEMDVYVKAANKHLMKMIDVVLDSGRHDLSPSDWNRMFEAKGVRG